MPAPIQISEARPRIQYVADGTRRDFVFPFFIFSASDLEVYIGDSIQATGFTVSGVAVAEGGTVTFETAPAATAIVTLRRQLALKRTSDFQESGTFRARVLNSELDHLIAAVQQVNEIAENSIRAAATDKVCNLVLPTAPQRAGCLLTFDDQGNATASFHGAATGALSWSSLQDIPESESVKHFTTEMESLLLAIAPGAAPNYQQVSEEEKSSAVQTELRSFSPKDIGEMIRSFSADGRIVDGGSASTTF